MMRQITQSLIIILIVILSSVYVFANTGDKALTITTTGSEVETLQSQNQASADQNAAIENKPESEIPLNLNKSATTVSTSSSSSKAVLSLVILFTMLGVSYYFIKKYRYSNSQLQDNLNIKILTQHHLGPKKSLAVIRIAGESILIGITDHQINHIKTLALIDDEVPQDQTMPQSFQDTFSNQNQTLNTGARAVFIDQQEDDFSFAQIKNQVVDKVRSMRNS